MNASPHERLPGATATRAVQASMLAHAFTRDRLTMRVEGSLAGRWIEITLPAGEGACSRSVMRAMRSITRPCHPVPARAPGPMNRNDR